MTAAVAEEGSAAEDRHANWNDFEAAVKLKTGGRWWTMLRQLFFLSEFGLSDDGLQYLANYCKGAFADKDLNKERLAVFYWKGRVCVATRPWTPKPKDIELFIRRTPE